MYDFKFEFCIETLKKKAAQLITRENVQWVSLSATNILSYLHMEITSHDSRMDESITPARVCYIALISLLIS